MTAPAEDPKSLADHWMAWINKRKLWLKCDYCEKLFHPADLILAEGRYMIPIHGCTFLEERGLPEEMILPVVVRPGDPALLQLTDPEPVKKAYQERDTAVFMATVKKALFDQVGFAKVCEMGECIPGRDTPAVDYCHVCNKCLCSYHAGAHGHGSPDPAAPSVNP